MDKIPFKVTLKRKTLSLSHWYFISYLPQEEIRVISLLTIYETWEFEAEGVPGWKKVHFESKIPLPNFFNLMDR